MKMRYRLPAALMVVGMFLFSACTPRFSSPFTSVARAEKDKIRLNPPESAYYHYAVARIARLRGNLDVAIANLKDAIRIDTQSAFLKRELATIYLDKQDLDGAFRVIREARQQHPKDVAVLSLYGRIAEEREDPAEAVKAYVAALAVDPNHQELYLHLGLLYLGEGDAEKARSVFHRLVKRFPDAYAGYFYLARIDMEQGHLDSAETLLKKTLSIRPDLDQPRFELIEIYRKQGKTAAVAALYAEIYRHNPTNVRAALGLALSWHREGKPEDATRLLAILGKRSARDFTVVSTLFQQYIEAKRFDDARVLIKGMLPAAPANSELLYLMGLALDGLNQKSEAVGFLLKVEPGSRFFAEATSLAAFLYQDMDKPEAAIDLLRTAIREAPKNANFYLYLGSLYEEKNQFDAAADVLGKGIAVDPSNTELNFRLGVVYDKWGNKAASIKAMKRVIELNPRHASALNYLGYTYTEEGRHLTEAEALIKRALAVKPDDGYIIDSLGWVYFKQGRFADALAELKKAVLRVPDDPIILEHLGDAYQKNGDTKNALTVYRRALKNKKADTKTAPLIEKIKRLEQGGK